MLHTWEKFNSTTKYDYIIEESTFEQVKCYHGTQGYTYWTEASYDEVNHRFDLIGRTHGLWGVWADVGMIFKNMPYNADPISEIKAPAGFYDDFSSTYYLVTEATGETNNRILSGIKYSVEYKLVPAIGEISKGFVSSKNRNEYKDNKQNEDNLWYVYRGIM